MQDHAEELTEADQEADIAEPTDQDDPSFSIVPNQENHEDDAPPSFMVSMGEEILNYQQLREQINTFMDTAFDERTPDLIAATAEELMTAAEALKDKISDLVWPTICLIPPEDVNIEYKVEWSALDNTVRNAALGGHHQLEIFVAPKQKNTVLLEATFTMEDEDIITVPIANISAAAEHRAGEDPNDDVVEDTNQNTEEGDLPYE